MATLLGYSSNISLILSSMRQSLERSSYTRRNPLEISDVASIAGKIEAIRFELNSHSRYQAEPMSEKVFRHAIDTLSAKLDELISDKDYGLVASNCIFRLVPGGKNRSLPFVEHFEPALNETINLLQATELLRIGLERISSVENLHNIALASEENIAVNHPVSDVTYSTESAIKDLKRIVPAQKIAPVQFKISDGKIVIDRNKSTSSDQDKPNITAAKEEILKNGRDIIEQLQKSNCDKRLIQNIEALHEQISSDTNAIQVGISNISFGVMSEVFKSELPDAINAKLQSHNLSINMYVAQFPDWARFSENAALAEINQDDVESIRDNADSIAEYLNDNQDITEPNVVRAFKQLGSLLKTPAVTAKRATFAVIRSIENLLSKIFTYTIMLFEQTIKKTIDELSTKISKTIAISIVSLGIMSASQLTGLSTKIKELSWLNNAIEIVQKQMNKIK